MTVFGNGVYFHSFQSVDSRNDENILDFHESQGDSRNYERKNASYDSRFMDCHATHLAMTNTAKIPMIYKVKSRNDEIPQNPAESNLKSRFTTHRI